MYKKAIAFLSILPLYLSHVVIPVNAADVTEINRKYLEVPYKAWKELGSYQNSSKVKVRVKMHASPDHDIKSKMLYQKGFEDMLNQFSYLFSHEDSFHIIMATNYDNAIKLTDEVVAELPEYKLYTTRHLSVAKKNFMGEQNSYSGGTSSRGCWYSGGVYGDKGNSIVPCPQLKGGVIYSFNPNPEKITWMERVGGHEAFHIIMSKMNAMSHYRMPEWIIEGTIEAMSFAKVTNSSNYKQLNYFFNPTPRWRPTLTRELYDLDSLDYPKGQMSDDRFSIGFMAISLLSAEIGAKKLFEFISIFGGPRNWKEDFKDIFGFTAEEFYGKFRDYHHWYFYDGGYELIQNHQYFPEITSKTLSTKKINITCVKGKTIKKVAGVNPKCPDGYKKK